MKTLLSLSACFCLAVSAAAQAEEIPELIKKLKDKEATSRRDAASALAERGSEAKPALQALIFATKDKDLFVRRFAVKAIGAIGPDAKAGIPALTLALKDPKTEVAEAAAVALAKVNAGKAALNPLINALKDKGSDGVVRKKAIETIGKIGPDAKPAVTALTDALKDREIRIEAAIALGNIGPEAKDALPALQAGAAEKSRDRAFKQAAAQAVRKIEGVKKK